MCLLICTCACMCVGTCSCVCEVAKVSMSWYRSGTTDAYASVHVQMYVCTYVFVCVWSSQGINIAVSLWDHRCVCLYVRLRAFVCMHVQVHVLMRFVFFCTYRLPVCVRMSCTHVCVQKHTNILEQTHIHVNGSVNELGPQ